MILINLTAHQIIVNGKTILPTGYVARAVTKSNQVGEVNGIPLVVTKVQDINNLPAPEENVFYIVTSMVREACPDRQDLISPTRLIRDQNNNIIGCSAFEVNV